MSNRIPIIGGGKKNPQMGAMEAFVRLKEDVAIQKAVIHSQARLILELVRRFGGGLMLPGEARTIRLKKETLMGLEANWELITADDEETNELVLIARKAVDITVNGKNSPTI